MDVQSRVVARLNARIGWVGCSSSTAGLLDAHSAFEVPRQDREGVPPPVVPFEFGAIVVAPQVASSGSRSS